MRAPRPPRLFRICAGILALLLGASGCSLMSPHSDIEISKRYPVGNSPSPECLDAAKRATYWCERGTPRSDPDAQGKCLKAQWDHSREC
jgi:hypothetical protein